MKSKTSRIKSTGSGLPDTCLFGKTGATKQVVGGNRRFPGLAAVET
ncbi:MAG: hypothetical protein ACK5S6_04790 [bacterium]